MSSRSLPNRNVAEAERKHVRKGLEFVLPSPGNVVTPTCKRKLPSQVKIGGQVRVIREKRLGKLHHGKQNVQHTSRELPSTEESTRLRFSKAEGRQFDPKLLLLTRRGQVCFILLVCWFPCVRHGPGVRTEVQSMVRRGWLPFSNRCANRGGLL